MILLKLIDRFMKEKEQCIYVLYTDKTLSSLGFFIYEYVVLYNFLPLFFCLWLLNECHFLISISQHNCYKVKDRGVIHSEKFGAFVVQQDVRMIVDHCSLAVLDETIESSSENRSSCDFQGTVPGEKFLLAPMPVQLGGRISPRASYPRGLTSTGFVGCIKNFVHNGEVSLASCIISVLYMYAVMCIKSLTLRHYRV